MTAAEWTAIGIFILGGIQAGVFLLIAHFNGRVTKLETAVSTLESLQAAQDQKHETVMEIMKRVEKGLEEVLVWQRQKDRDIAEFYRRNPEGERAQ